MKLAKLITVAVLGMAFVGTSAMAAPARPDGGKTVAKGGHHKHHGKKHAKKALKKHSKHARKHASKNAA